MICGPYGLSGSSFLFYAAHRDAAVHGCRVYPGVLRKLFEASDLFYNWTGTDARFFSVYILVWAGGS